MPHPDRRSPSDDFEAKHMPTTGSVLHRSKQVSRVLAGVPLVFALLFVLAGILLATGVLAPVPQLLSLVAFGLAAMNAFLGLALSGLRTVLTSDELRIQFGLWGPRIAVDAIESCEVVDYDVRKYRGYGLKIRNGVRIYSVPGCKQAIALRYAGDAGRPVDVVFTAEDPVALAREIQRARSARTGSEPGLRIDMDGVESAAGRAASAAAASGAAREHAESDEASAASGEQRRARR